MDILSKILTIHTPNFFFVRPKGELQTSEASLSAPARKEDNPHYREICAAWVRLTRREKGGPQGPGQERAPLRRL